MLLRFASRRSGSETGREKGRQRPEREDLTMIFGKKAQSAAPAAEKKEKPTPAYLREDYPYKAIGDPITDLETLETGVVYEIKCHQCEMSIRSQGQNIRATYARLKDSGCIGCGNKDLVVRKVDMSKAPKQTP